MRKSWLQSSLIAMLAAGAALAAETGKHPTGNRTTPPTLDSVAPLGIARGTAVELTPGGERSPARGCLAAPDPGVLRPVPVLRHAVRSRLVRGHHVRPEGVSDRTPARRRGMVVGTSAVGGHECGDAEKNGKHVESFG